MPSRRKQPAEDALISPCSASVFSNGVFLGVMSTDTADTIAIDRVPAIVQIAIAHRHD
jgi:hypothetical protein